MLILRLLQNHTEITECASRSQFLMCSFILRPRPHAVAPPWSRVHRQSRPSLLRLAPLHTCPSLIRFPRPPPVVLLSLAPQIYRCRNGDMISRQNCGRVRVTTEPPVGDKEIGLELDMCERVQAAKGMRKLDMLNNSNILETPKMMALVFD